MNRRELVRAVAAHTGQEVRQVDAIIGGAVEVITAVVSQGERVSIPGFAKFAKVERPARMGRNPATGETIRIKASKRARITALKGFKDAVMTASQAPKLARGVWPTDPALLVKKAAAPKAAPAKKAAAKKVGAKKAPAKKRAAAKKAPAKRKAAPARKKATAARRPAKKTTVRKAAARRR